MHCSSGKCWNQGDKCIMEKDCSGHTSRMARRNIPWLRLQGKPGRGKVYTTAKEGQCDWEKQGSGTRVCHNMIPSHPVGL